MFISYVQGLNEEELLLVEALSALASCGLPLLLVRTADHVGCHRGSLFIAVAIAAVAYPALMFVSKNKRFIVFILYVGILLILYVY